VSEPNAIIPSLAELTAQSIWTGVVGRVRHGHGLTVAVVEVDPESVIPEHRHLNEQIGVLIRGAVTFTVGADERALKPGATWVIPPHVPHDVRAGTEGAVIIEAFAPHREDWRLLAEVHDRAPRWPE
jgi:unsaturated pyranuronate lyase